MKYRYLYFAISLVVILPGIISLLLFGLKPSIDFTGGSLLEITIIQNAQNAPINQASLQTIVGEEYQLSAVQPTGNNNFILRGKPLTNEQKNQVMAKLETGIGQIQEQRFETVGPTLGRELLTKTIVAGILAATMIIIYIWSQFHDFKFGMAAILAMIHDGLVLVGTFSILGKLFGVEVDILFVTALLTVLSFSVHDTIVVFDRIREMSKKHPRIPFNDLVNGAVLQTLARSINNSITVIIMLSALVLLGGQTIRWFAVALLIGAVTGTYSSTFTAVPLLVVWNDLTASIKKRQR